MQNNGMDEISALVDDELRGGELERAMRRLREPDGAARWARYHFISDALRNHLGPHGIDPGFSDRVRAALASEPVPLRRRPGGRFVSTAHWRPVAALALAASVAAAAVLFVLEREAVAPPVAAIAVAPASIAAADSESRPDLSPYLVNHTEYSRSPGLQGMLPYVRIVSHE